jgi:acyl-CoA dehydrogenase
VDFEIPGEHRELVASFRMFLEREVRPVEERFQPELQDDRWDDRMRRAGPELRRRSAELGFYAAHMPADVGGGDCRT